MARILVVDDSPLDQQIAGSLLEKHLQAEISYANDGVEALDRVSQDAPEMVLTDLQMPNMDGLELVGALAEKHPMIPVILMTAAGSEEIAIKAIAAGASSYVPKRQLADELCGIVSNVLEISGERRTEFRVLLRQLRFETEFALENDLNLILGTAGHLMRTLRGMSVCDRSEETRIGVALTEALLNAYFHGNLEMPSGLRDESPSAFHEMAKKRSQQPGYKERRITVNARFSRNDVVLSIRDGGKGFDTSQLPNHADATAMKRPHGRGLFLMRSFMDEVRFNQTGNGVTMVKRASKPKV